MLATQKAAQPLSGLPDEQHAAKRTRTDANIPPDPASGGSGSSTATAVDGKAMPIARFDPSLVAAVKCANEILQSDDGWSKEEAAAIIGVLANKFQNSKRRHTGATSGTTGARSGEASQPLSQPEQHAAVFAAQARQQQQLQQLQQQQQQREQCEQSGPQQPAGALGAFGSLYCQPPPQQQPAAGSESLPGPSPDPLLPGSAKPSGATAAGVPDQQAWTNGTGITDADDDAAAAAAGSPAVNDIPPNGPARPARAAGIGYVGLDLSNEDDGPPAAPADMPSTAAATAAAGEHKQRRSASLDAVSGSTAGLSQPSSAAAKIQAAAAAAADAHAGDNKPLQHGACGPVASGFGSVPGSPGAPAAEAAAGTDGAFNQPPLPQQQQQQEIPQPDSAKAAPTAAPAGRRTLDAASAAAVAAAAKAASKIAATTGGGFGGPSGDLLSDAGGNRTDQALRLPGDPAAAPGTASSPMAAVGSSSCAEASAQRQGSGNAGEAAATSAEAGVGAPNPSQHLSGSLEEILAQVGAQPGANGQLQLPLALMQLLQSGQPQALPLMSALLRSGNLRPLVADALKVRLSTYLTQQQQQQQGMAADAAAAAAADIAAASAPGAAGEAPDSSLQQQQQQHNQQQQQQRHMMPGAVSSDSRSAGSTAAGSAVSAEPPAPVEAKRKRGRQPTTKAAAAAAERPRKRQAKGAAAAAEAEASADVAAAPVEMTATGRPKRGRPAKGGKAAAAPAAAAAAAAALAATRSALGGLDTALLMDNTANNYQPDLAGTADLLLQQQSMQQLQGGSSMPAGGLTALLAEDDGPMQAQAAAQAPAGLQQPNTAPGVVSTPSLATADAQQQPQPQQPQYDTSSIADCPELLQRLQELPQQAVQQVLDMASKLPEDMPQKWKQTVLLQAAESAMNVLHMQQPQQQQDQQQAAAGGVSELPARVPTAAAGSKAAGQEQDAAAAAAQMATMPGGLLDPQKAAASGGATDSQGMQAAAGAQQGSGGAEDVLPGLLAAAQNHPQLRCMTAEKREALLKQLLQQHQVRRAKALMGQAQGLQHSMQSGAMQDPGRAAAAAAGLNWNSFGSQAQQQQAAAATSLGLSPHPGQLNAAGSADMSWLQGMGSGTAASRQQQQGGLQSAHSNPLGFSGLNGLDQQHQQGLADPAYAAAFAGPVSAGAAAGFDAFGVDTAAGLGGGAGDGSRAAAATGGGGGGSSNWDTSNILSGLMGSAAPEMRHQYMRKLQQQLEMNGLNKKQLVDLMKSKGPLAALRSIGMLPADMPARAGSSLGSTDLQTAAVAAAAAAPVSGAASGMDPAMAAAMPSEAAFAAMRQQQLQQQQQQLNLGPHQQAWLQHQQQAGVAGMSGDGMTALLAQHQAQQQQQQWQDMLGLQAGLSGYPNLLGPSLYNGLGGVQAGDRGPGSVGGLGGMAGRPDGLAGLMAGSQQALLLQQQQQQQAMAYSSAMAGAFQQPHGSMGGLTPQQQQQLLYQQQQLASLQMGQHVGLGGGGVTGAAGAWGNLGLAGLQAGSGSSAALDPPVLELPTLSPIKTSHGAGAGASGALPAVAASSAATTAGAGSLQGVAAAGSAGYAAHRAAGSGIGAAARHVSQCGVSQAPPGPSQQLLQRLEIPGSLGELGGHCDDEGMAISPFGQLGLNAADVDALLSGMEPSSMNLLGHAEDGGGASSSFKMQDVWSNIRGS